MPRLLDVQVWGESARRTVDLPGEGEIPCGGQWLLPTLVDLCCDPGFPGFPVRETRKSLSEAAVAGGFDSLLLGPRLEPVLDTPEQVPAPDAPGGVRFWTAAALTMGLKGEELAEVGLLKRAGVVALSDGGIPIANTVVLRNALEYAAAFGIRLHLRPADPHLDQLGVVHEGPLSAALGLRGNPAANEEIGIQRILSLLAALPASAGVHLTHIGTRRGVALIREAQARGLSVTASTPARNLVLDETVLDDGNYHSRYRLFPPLRSVSDREALIDGVCDGTLLLAADHQPRAPEEKEHEFERAATGSTGLESAFSAAWTALSARPNGLSCLLTAFSSGPRHLVGNSAPGWMLVDLEAETVVTAALHKSYARNDALEGRHLKGQIRGCWPGSTTKQEMPAPPVQVTSAT